MGFFISILFYLKKHKEMLIMSIPVAPIGRIIKDAGAERVSEDAKVELADSLDEIARNIAIKANEAAKLAKRKTVKADDIKFAVKELNL